MKMLADNVLVTEVPTEEKSSGGIILTESIDNASKPGLILAVGSGANGLLKSGQRVFLEWDKAMPVNVDGNAAVIIKSEYVRAIIGE